MKVKILTTFHDACDFSKVYVEGSEAEFDGERLTDLLRLGYVEEAEKPKKGRKPKTE